jgi:hypothetical protein
MSTPFRSSALWSILFLVSTTAQAANIVTVLAASGRQFRGLVDPQTNEQALWIRGGKPQAFVRRPIAWDRVVAVTVGDTKHSADEFRRLIASPNCDLFVDDLTTAIPHGVASGSPEDVASNQSAGNWELADSRHDPSPRIAALHIDTHLSNWDSDVEVDGLVVHVYPLDETGETIAAFGTLDVDLIGEGYTNLVSGNPFPVLGRWSQVVHPEEVGTNGAIFRLPFERVHPDFNRKWDVGSYGMVHARLSVAGQGVFEDTAAFTRIRPYSPIRDRMQQVRGTRFHPWELTSQGTW